MIEWMALALGRAAGFVVPATAQMKSMGEIAALAVGITAILTSASISAAEIDCPESIHESPTVALADRQWTVSAKPGARPIEHPGVHLSIAGEYGAQVPDSTVSQTEERVTWQMARSETEKFAVGCTYSGTTAVLFKALDSLVTRCVATYTLLPTGKRQRLQSMNCE